MIAKKKLIGGIFTVCGAVLLLLSLVNFSTQTRNITLSHNFLNNIASVDWSDEEKLTELGFEKENNEYVLYTDNEHVGSIYAVKDNEIPKGAQEYNSIHYTATESSIGKLDVKRLWKKEISVYRRYEIYINGMKIYAREDNFEGQNPAIENLAIQ